MKKLFLSFILFNLIAILGIGFLFQQKWERSYTHDLKTLTIPKGAGLSKVSMLLEEKKIIDNALDFKIYVKWQGGERLIKSGEFTLPSPITFPKLLSILKKGQSASLKVTIPEGRASWEIYSILKKHYPSLDSSKWEALVHDKTFAKALNIPHSTLEGFLYPETYQMPLKASEKQLMKILVKQHFKTWNSLASKNSIVFQKHGHLGALTLASVVEEEAAVRKEQGEIAGVFWNRVVKGMPLGADPTVRFIYRNLNGPIYRSQLNSDNPYNTRKFRGLPPGPISNPGKGAMQAALNPKTTKNLYFVGKDDGSREHFFAPSLKKHNEYREVAAKNRKKYGTAKGLY